MVNGSAADKSALIIGNNGTFGTGIGGGSGTTGISNFGTIKGVNTGIVIGNGTVGAKGTVVNGSTADTAALITGGTGTIGTGIFINSATVSISNFGHRQRRWQWHQFRHQRHRGERRHGGEWQRG